MNVTYFFIPECTCRTGGNTGRLFSFFHSGCAQVALTEREHLQFHPLTQNSKRTGKYTTPASGTACRISPYNTILITGHRIPWAGSDTGRLLTVPADNRQVSNTLNSGTLKGDSLVTYPLAGDRMCLAAYTEIKMYK